MPPRSRDRKADHFEICAEARANFRHKTTLFEEVELIHRALPELGLDEIDLATNFLGKALAAPIWISAMTGGTARARNFNRELAQLAQSLGIGFCLGSMRPFLNHPDVKHDYAVRDVAPSVLLMTNIGATELVRRGTGPILAAIDALGADGLTIHLNPAMELIQPEGDTNFVGALNGIEDLVQHAPELPIVVKETGCGLSIEDGERLKRIGVTHVEICGAGGTSWVGVEAQRSDEQQAKIGEMLWDWGIPTAVSTLWMVRQEFQVVASGGIRTALDMARALALGARLTGLAGPIVQAYRAGGPDRVEAQLNGLIVGLKTVMLLCGAKRVADLSAVPRIIGPNLSRWLTPQPSALK